VWLCGFDHISCRASWEVAGAAADLTTSRSLKVCRYEFQAIAGIRTSDVFEFQVASAQRNEYEYGGLG
jgi:hypothetical protein